MTYAYGPLVTKAIEQFRPSAEATIENYLVGKWKSVKPEHAEANERYRQDLIAFTMDFEARHIHKWDMSL